MTQPDAIKRLEQQAARFDQELRGQDYPMPERISYVADLGNMRAYFPTHDRYTRDWFYPRYRGGKLHEPMLTRHLFASLTPRSVFVDVGAHLGYFSVIAALKARAVFAIEPQEFLIGRIHLNAAANHLQNLTILHAAAGSAPGFARIPKMGLPTTEIGTSNNLVPMIRLDDYFTGALQPTHIKIDTEGFELHVLDGARQILAARPVLYVEVHRGMEKFGGTATDMWDLLTAQGYRVTVGYHRGEAAEFVDVPREQITTFNDAMLICEPKPEGEQ